jgi:hypothetical protein
MEDVSLSNSVNRERVACLKQRAFLANRCAKRSEGDQREAFYRRKHAAINYLLEVGAAFVTDVDWFAPDPIFSVEFVDGSKLHTTLSSLDSGAMRSVRRQLNGDTLCAA